MPTLSAERALLTVALLTWATATSCPAPQGPPPRVETPAPPPLARASAPPDPVAPPASTTPTEPPPPPGPCPTGMIYVEADHCARVEQTCLKKGRSKPRHPPKCLEYAEPSVCKGPVRRQRFCIDRYEYPNREGAHPPSMINAWDADLLCREQGKRLCWESEWTLACEGPERLPYPYGYVRDATLCNIDKPYLKPGQKTIHGHDAEAREAELRRLDQSARSGEVAGCRSAWGVHDLSGNFSEWVYLEKPRGKGRWAGTKGGHWVPLRNVCRLTSVAHPESWRYYPLSTRCCADPDPEALPPVEPGAPPLWTPPRPHPTEHWRAEGHFHRGWTP